MKAIFLLILLCLVSCDQARQPSSELSIANGDQALLTLGEEVGELPFLIGYRLSDDRHHMPDKICTGFRYGYQTIITAASCMEQMLGPIQTSKPRFLQMMSGKGHAFETVEVDVQQHAGWRYRCNNSELRCPDIGIISLPDAFADRDVFRAMTDPVRIDRSPGIPSGVDLAGYGCVDDDFKNPGGCTQGTSFDKFAFSIGFDFHEKNQTTLKKAVPDYFRTIEGEKTVEVEPETSAEPEVFPYGITSGDTGGSLFRNIGKADRINAKDKFKLDNGETHQYVVEGMAVFVDPSFVLDSVPFKYANVVLDLGHPEVSDWLGDALQDDGYNLKNSPATPPKNPPAFGAACSPENLTLSEVPYKQRDDLNDLIGHALPYNAERDILLESLNKINHGWSQLVLASCISYVERSILDIETTSNLDQVTRDAKLAPLEYARLLNVIMIEQIIAWQEEVANRADIEKELAAAQKEMSLSLELAKAGGEAIVGAVPGVALGYDLYLITTGKNLYGDSVSTFERGMTALTIVVPGFLKAGGKLAAKSAKALRIAAAITKKIEKYRELAGTIGEQVVIAAKRVKDTPAFLGNVYQSAARFGIKRVEDLRRFASIGRMYIPSCKVLDSLAATEPLPQWQRIFLSPWDIVVPVAYASGMDPTLLECLTRLDKIYEKALVRWTKETFEHVLKGDQVLVNGVTKLTSGLHTKQAMKELMELNTKEGVNRRIVTVNSFDLTNGFSKLNETGSALKVADDTVILQKVHPNGVIQSQCPLGLFQNSKKGQNASQPIPGAPKLWGVKTLWPESFTPEDIIRVTEEVIAKAKQNGEQLKDVISGTHDGIKVTVRFNADGTVRTAYPAWDQ
ncbi:MAG TPA: EndoU domain-containing protein [Oligoflexus sp.]|uniref:EndoU domain-containing protein n=1 Tax=Oligoflexus sp. TaxID=1971216 RepID=UPI002D529C8D|nr:EndoU domain-containing protein [Oligoflexus sp.]HYX33189.1 EndoU domain-containing protein [Oligoflexus sp.]